MIRMTEREIVGIAAAFLLVIGVTVAEMRRWLPRGRAKLVLVFLVGVAVIASLRAAGLPPRWFAGGRDALELIAMLTGMAFVSAFGTARTFGPPLLGGMAVALSVLNVLVHV